MVLLTAVLLYDNPLFPLILLVYSPLISVIDCCFTVTFFCVLLMFWLCVYHGIRKSERHFFSFYLIKIALVGLMWIIGCVILSWSALYESIDPTYSLTQVCISVKFYFCADCALVLLYWYYDLTNIFKSWYKKTNCKRILEELYDNNQGANFRIKQDFSVSK